jgi:hypothetical protein
VRPSIDRAVVVLVLAAAAVSCSKTLDTSGLETTIKQNLEAELGATGIQVTCPTGLKVEKGATFNCTVAVPGSGSLSIAVTQTDDKGNVTYKIVGLVPSSTPSPTG